MEFVLGAGCLGGDTGESLGQGQHFSLLGLGLGDHWAYKVFGHFLVQEHVLGQGGLVKESFVADLAWESFALRNGDMGLRVLFEIGGCRESLSAFSTLEGLFTSVDFLVSLEVGDLRKISLTLMIRST